MPCRAIRAIRDLPMESPNSNTWQWSKTIWRWQILTMVYSAAILKPPHLRRSSARNQILLNVARTKTPIRRLRTQDNVVYHLTRVDSRDLQTSNISIWRYHCLGEVAFLKIWNQYWLYCLIQYIRGFYASRLPIFKLKSTGPLNQL